MTRHLLREWTRLDGMPVVYRGERQGRLLGLGFDDRSLRVVDFIVAPGDSRANTVRISVDAGTRLDEHRGELVVDRSAGETERQASAEPANPCVDAAALVGRTIQCLDGPAGTVLDLLINVGTWKLRYFLVGVGDRRIMTDIEWCSSFASRGGPSLELPVEALQTAPGYPGLDALCSGVEEAFYRHYTRRRFNRAGRAAAGAA